MDRKFLELYVIQGSRGQDKKEMGTVAGEKAASLMKDLVR